MKEIVVIHDAKVFGRRELFKNFNFGPSCTSKICLTWEMSVFCAANASHLSFNPMKIRIGFVVLIFNVMFSNFSRSIRSGSEIGAVSPSFHFLFRSACDG